MLRCVSICASLNASLYVLGTAENRASRVGFTGTMSMLLATASSLTASAISEACLETSDVNISLNDFAKRSSKLSPVKNFLTASCQISSVPLAFLSTASTSSYIALETFLAMSSSRPSIISSVKPAALYTLRTPSNTSSAELAITLLVAAFPPKERNVPGSIAISRGSVRNKDFQNPISSPFSCMTWSYSKLGVVP